MKYHIIIKENSILVDSQKKSEESQKVTCIPMGISALFTIAER